MGPTQILENLESLGVRVELCGDKLRLYGASKVPSDLKAELVKRKPEVMAPLRIHTTLYDLPFPMGYGGLPRAQVEMAEAIQEKLGITDPILRKYNVLSWIRAHLQYLSLNHGPLYEALVAEQTRLRAILDEDTKGVSP